MASEGLTPQGAPYLGRWHLPGQSEDVVGGQLTLTNEIWGLTLSGWLGPWDRQARDFTPTVVHGSIGTTPVTIMNIVPRGWSMQDAQPPHETQLSANTVLLGDLVDDTLLIQQAFVRLRHLNEWANRFPWRVEAGSSHEAITFTPPEPRIASVGGARISLVRTRSKRIGLSVASMGSDEAFRLEFVTPQNLDLVLHDWIRPLIGLLEMASGMPSEVLDLTIWPANCDQYHSGIIVLSELSRKPDQAAQPSFQMLFNLDDVDFEIFLSDYWKLHERLGIVFDLLAAIRGRGYVGSQFMAAATAVEAYHRRQFERVTISDEHRARLKRIISAIPSHDRSWVNERLAFSHEPSFGSRIDEVIERAGPLFPDIVGDVAKWRKWVKNGRNGSAHRGPAMIDVDAEWRVTVRVTETIRWLLTLALLRDLGIDDDTIEVRTRQQRGLQAARDNLKAVKPEWFV